MIKQCKYHGMTEHRLEKGWADKKGYTRPDYFRCKVCESENNIQKRIKRQTFACVLLKEYGAKCARCGYDGCPEILQWHHTNPADKLFEISRAICSMGKNVTAEDIKLEAKKCVLLCPNCHAKEHTNYSYSELMKKVNLLGV